MTKFLSCALCDCAIDENNDSREHLIPNAIGGRNELTGFLCEKCNNERGRNWEAALAKQLNYFCLALGIKRSRGRPPGQVVTTTEGTTLYLNPNGTLTSRSPIFEKTASDGKMHLKLFARDESEAREILRGIKEKHAPNLDVEKELAGFETGPFKIAGALQHRLELDGPEMSRSIVKTALAFAVSMGIPAAKCEVARATLLSNIDNSAYALFYLHDVVINRPHDELFHVVSVNGNRENRALLAYVEYFGFLRMIVNLSSDYVGDDIDFTYAINPRTGLDLDVSIDWAILEQLAADALSGYGVRLFLDAACNHALAVAAHYRTKRERSHRFKKELDAAMLEMGLPPGSTPPDSRRDEFNEIMSRILGDFPNLDSDLKSFKSISGKR